MRPLFHHVAAAGSTEFFMAACLLVVIGTAVVTALSGLSMGLGAFIAGLLLAETEYRREIEVTIEPFKGLLLGLFFVAIGAGLDFGQVVRHPGLTLGLAVGFIAIKVAVTFLAACAMKLPWRVATESSLMLAPGGEFAFVLLAAALEGKIVAAWRRRSRRDRRHALVVRRAGPGDPRAASRSAHAGSRPASRGDAGRVRLDRSARLARRLRGASGNSSAR